MYSDGTQIGLAIQNTEGCPVLNGVFTEDGLVRLIKAVDIKMDITSLPIGGLVDRIYVEIKNCPITRSGLIQPLKQK